jgi:hypothetical protein
MISYLLSLLDTIYKIAVIFFVALQFGWIKDVRGNTTKDDETSKTNNRSGFNIMDLAGPMIEQLSKSNLAPKPETSDDDLESSVFVSNSTEKE